MSMSLPRKPPRLGIGTQEGPQTQYETAAQSYQDDYGWAVGVYRSGVWLVSGRGVDALDMPRELGERVQLATGNSVPLFESPEDNSTRWVFLVASHTGPAEPRMAELGIDHIRAGRCVDLPPSEFGQHRLRWISTPSGLLTPDFTTVVHAVLQAR
ncbi:hypothetical protein [Lentzea sp. NPDC060358]|uniref:hypothetical protein n=1 Tax=Lentzea sp. NPDC060358 TaxID=3347103 RepID=UPI00365A7D5A